MMKPDMLLIGRSILFVQVLLVAACQSTGSGGGGTGGQAGGSGGATGSGGMTATAGVPGSAGTGGSGGGGLGTAGNTGAAGAAGSTGMGGSAGAGPGAGGHATDGGPADAAATGGTSAAAGGAGTGGRATGGATTSSGGVSGVGGVGAGGRLGGAGGMSSGSGGQGAGGQTGTGGSTVVTCTTPTPTGGSYTVDTTGVTFTVGTGKMRVQVCTADIIRVQYTNTSTIPTKNSLSVSNTWATAPSFCVSESSGTLTITTARIKAKVNESTGVISYTDLSDNVVLAEDSKSVTAATVQGTSTNKIQTVFNSPASEGLFGLGQHPDNVMNFKGNTENNMVNSNGWINIPMLVSSKGYGLFWDNYSSSSFAGNVSGNTKFSFTSQAGEGVDYYFFYGPTIDQVIAGYRTTTGAAPLFPKWAYGLFQSKDHYGSSNRILNVVRLSQRQHPGRRGRSGLGLLGSLFLGLPYHGSEEYPDPATLVSTAHRQHPRDDLDLAGVSIHGQPARGRRWRE
jgi:hypothetical protein